jgi:hypothetical protein
MMISFKGFFAIIVQTAVFWVNTNMLPPKWWHPPTGLQGAINKIYHNLSMKGVLKEVRPFISQFKQNIIY